MWVGEHSAVFLCLLKNEMPVCQNLGPYPFTMSLPCRVFLALVEEVEDRGTVVAQGGGKVSWLLTPS